MLLRTLWQLRSKNSYIRQKAAERLGDAGSRWAVKPLIAALKDEDKNVRENAAGALGLIGDHQATDSLVAALGDSNGDVRKRAANGLKSLGWEPADEAQRALNAAALERWDEVASLGSASLEVLQFVLKSKYEYDRVQAVETLGVVGRPAIDLLVKALADVDERVREKAAQALGRIGDRRAVDSLVTALEDSRSKVRKASAESLKSLGWKPADDVQGARYAAALQLWGFLVTLEPAGIECLESLVKTKEPYIGEEVAMALVLLDDPRTRKPLVAALEHNSPNVRKAAIKALQRFASEDSGLQELVSRHRLAESKREHAAWLESEARVAQERQKQREEMARYTRPCVLCGTTTDFTAGLGHNTISLALSHGIRQAYVLCRGCSSGQDTAVLAAKILAVSEERRDKSWSHDD